jgi:hypothetical protein
MGPKLLKFKLIENNQVVHTGEFYSQFITIMNDMYLDFEPDSRYTLVIEYNGVEHVINDLAGHVYNK